MNINIMVAYYLLGSVQYVEDWWNLENPKFGVRQDFFDRGDHSYKLWIEQDMKTLRRLYEY